MVVLLNHIELPEVTIAIDGSLYEHHPKYHKYMMEIIEKWRPQTKVGQIYFFFAVKRQDITKVKECLNSFVKAFITIELRLDMNINIPLGDIPHQPF